MSKLSVATFSLMGVLYGSGVAAQPSDPSPVPPSQTPAAGIEDGDRLVCQSVRYTGTRFPVRVCKTKAQLEEQKRSKAGAVDKFTDKTRRFNVSGADGAYARHSRGEDDR